MIFPNSNTGVLEKKLQRIMETFCSSVINLKDGEKCQEEMRRGIDEYK